MSGHVAVVEQFGGFAILADFGICLAAPGDDADVLRRKLLRGADRALFALLLQPFGGCNQFAGLVAVERDDDDDFRRFSLGQTWLLITMPVAA